MTVLTIIQSVADRIGIPRPSAVVSSSDQQVRQLFALLNEGGVELSKRADWQVLTTEWTFLTVAADEQTNTPIPTDLDRFLADSFYDRTLSRKLIGPITPQEWQAVKARPQFSRVYLAFRERDNTVLITPPPPADHLIAYEYISKNWAKSSANVGKEMFTSDDDTSYLSEELLKLDLRWRWKQAKGLEYGEDMDTFERALQREAGNDGAARMLSIGGTDQAIYPLGINLPEGGFGI